MQPLFLDAPCHYQQTAALQQEFALGSGCIAAFHHKSPGSPQTDRSYRWLRAEFFFVVGVVPHGIAPIAIPIQ